MQARSHPSNISSAGVGLNVRTMPAVPSSPNLSLLAGLDPTAEALRKVQRSQLLDLHTRGVNESKGVVGSARSWDHIENLDELLTKYDNAANTTDPDESSNWLSVLQQACVDGHDDCVKLLIQRGADVNYISKNGLTAAAFAAKYGHVACLMELKAAGADLDLRGASDVSLAPLACAASNGKDKCVQFLIASKANVVEDDYRYNPLLLAAKTKGNHRCAELLLQAASSLANISDAHGNTALIVAARRGDIDLVRSIVEQVTTLEGTDPAVINHANDAGDTALRVAKMAGSRGQGPTVVAYLLEKGAKDSMTGNAVISEFEFVDESEWDSIEAELGAMMERVRSLNDRVSKAMIQRDRRGTMGGRTSLAGMTGSFGHMNRPSLSLGRQSISIPGTTSVPSSRGSFAMPSPGFVAGQSSRSSVSLVQTPGQARNSVSFGSTGGPPVQSSRASVSFGGSGGTPGASTKPSVSFGAANISGAGTAAATTVAATASTRTGR
eukprot:Opistho-2@58683